MNKVDTKIVAAFNEALKTYGPNSPEMTAYKVIRPDMKRTFSAMIAHQQDILTKAWDQYLSVEQTSHERKTYQ